MKLSKKRKKFLAHILGNGHALSALSIEYSENLPAEFKDNYGITMREARRALDALLEFLNK